MNKHWVVQTPSATNAIRARQQLHFPSCSCMFFGSEMLNSKLRLKPCLKLHEAAQNALVRLPKHTHKRWLSLSGRLWDVFRTAIVSINEDMSKSDNVRETLLHSPQQASMTEADGDR